MSEKNCGNCKYYTSYYTKGKMRLWKTAAGVCLCHDFKWNGHRPKKETDAACEHWSSNEYVEGESMEYIQATLLQMARRVEEIALMLKSEE